MNQIIVAFLTGVLGPILVLYIKHLLDSRNKPDPLAEAVEHSNVVNDELDILLHEYGADRIWLAQFHNGGHYYPTGKSIQKFSIFFESVKNVKDSIRSGFQNIPVNLFSRPLGEVLENDFIAIPDYKDEKVATFGLKYTAEECNTKSSYLFAIRNVKGKMIGVLAVEYTGRKRKISDEDIIELRLKANTLGGVIMSHL